MRKILLVFAMMLTAIASEPVRAQNPNQAGASNDFIIRPGNLLKVRLWPDAEPSMSGEFVVETTGKVYLPAIGVMQAGGVPLLEFQRMVREQYSRVIKEAVVTVTPTFSVVLLGGVGSPGLYSIQPTTTLLETIAMAGGFTKDAKPEQLSLVRDGQTIPIDGQRALISGSGELAIRLQSGDRITIPTKRRTNWMSVYYTFQFLATAFILAKQVAK